MSGWSVTEGLAVALPRESVDTDQLIPARFMSVSRADGYGPYLLHDMRRDEAGALLADFPLNRAPEATILVARRNFGSGSSREAAVYALVDFGIRVVIAPSFGDIFSGNAVNNGLLPLVLPPETVEALLADLSESADEMTVDLARGQVRFRNRVHEFTLPDVWREKLLNGWDDIDLTISRAEAIAAYRDRRMSAAPWVWPEK